MSQTANRPLLTPLKQCSARSRGWIPRSGRVLEIAESARRLATMAIDLRLLSMAILRGPYPKTETMPLPSLYKEKPVVLYAIRRMG